MAVLFHQHGAVDDGAGRNQPGIGLFSGDDVDFRGHADQQRRVVGQADADAEGLVDRVALGGDVVDGTAKAAIGEGVGLDQHLLPRRHQGDVFLVHIGGDAQRPAFTDPEDGVLRFDHLARFAVAAQHHPVQGGDDQQIGAALTGGVDGGIGLIIFAFGLLRRFTRADAAIGQGLGPSQFLAPINRAGLKFVHLGAGLAVVETGQMLAALDHIALVHQHFGDAPGGHRADLGPVFRLDRTGGIDRFHCHAALWRHQGDRAGAVAVKGINGTGGQGGDDQDDRDDPGGFAGVHECQDTPPLASSHAYPQRC